MLPQKFEFLKSEPGPKMLLEMLKLYGIKEYPGAANNPTIMGWAEEVGLKGIYTGDNIAWAKAYTEEMKGFDTSIKFSKNKP